MILLETHSMDASYKQLESHLRSMEGGVVVAFSGGVDSSLVLAAAQDALGCRALAAIGCSPTYPAHEREAAVALAQQLGARHVLIETREHEDRAYRSNPSNRCYYCKRELFTELHELMLREGFHVVVDGFNADDHGDYRPGHTAGCELNVRSPLAELGLTKADIRRLARERGLPNWDQPACACLASRIPYGEEITVQRLERVAGAEALIRGLGFRTVRVRDHGQVARIELDKNDLVRVMDPAVRERVARECRQLGYAFVCVDMEGYRTGSMNEVLGITGKEQKVSA